MRRMISQKMQNGIKSLLTSTWSDENGNLEVGKDLLVDGNITCNGYIEDADGNSYLKDTDTNSLYLHNVKWYASPGKTTGSRVSLRFQWISHKAAPIDSLLDIATELYHAPSGHVAASGIYNNGTTERPVTGVFADGSLGADVGVEWATTDGQMYATKDGGLITGHSVVDDVIFLGDTVL